MAQRFSLSTLVLVLLGLIAGAYTQGESRVSESIPMPARVVVIWLLP